jgi:hypothetical protein
MLLHVLNLTSLFNINRKQIKCRFFFKFASINFMSVSLILGMIKDVIKEKQQPSILTENTILLMMKSLNLSYKNQLKIK